MRIVGGFARGCQLSGPGNKKIRPTADKVRQALFNMIDAEGTVFLDLFGGTGAVGLEALSRGAAAVTIVESHRHSLGLIRQNAEKVQRMIPSPGSLQLAAMDAVEFLRAPARSGRFDFIFCDPPYDWEGGAALLAAARDNKVLRPEGVLVLEQAARRPAPVGFEPLRVKKYGDTQLLFYSFPEQSA